MGPHYVALVWSLLCGVGASGGLQELRNLPALVSGVLGIRRAAPPPPTHIKACLVYLNLGSIYIIMSHTYKQSLSSVLSVGTILGFCVCLSSGDFPLILAHLKSLLQMNCRFTSSIASLLVTLRVPSEAARRKVKGSNGFR